MSKQPVGQQQAGGEPPSRARRANAAPSQPRPSRSRNASVQGEWQAVQGPMHDGAGSSAAMAARGGYGRHVSLVLPPQEGGQVVQHPRPREGRAPRGEEHPAAGHGGAEIMPRSAAGGRPRPFYVPPSQRRREQPYAVPPRPAIEQPPVHGPYPYEGAAGLPGAHPHQLPPGEAAPAGGGGLAATPAGGAAPPHGGGTTATGGAPPRRWIRGAKTMKEDRMEDARPPGGSPPPPAAHDARPEAPEPYRQTPPTQPPSGKKWQPSPMLLPERRKKKRPVVICFTACCILFWLLVVCIGIAILVVYLLYRPQPPRMRVTTATLNSGYIDELPPPRGGLALNSDLYVLAAIYNPNTKIDVVLRYMQLNLYFQGGLIGTQAVWPPMHEKPGDSALRSVHLVVSEVRMTQEDVALWQNATVNGSLVQMKLAGRFYAQLNFGRWLPFRYWVFPTCTLWLDPPPAGALRRARCRQ